MGNPVLFLIWQLQIKLRTWIHMQLWNWDILWLFSDREWKKYLELFTETSWNHLWTSPETFGSPWSSHQSFKSLERIPDLTKNITESPKNGSPRAKLRFKQYFWSNYWFLQEVRTFDKKSGYQGPRVMSLGGLGMFQYKNVSIFFSIL